LLKKSPVTKWFESRFANPTPAQSAAWPLIERGKDVLIVSPTGTGKTFAAFLSVLNELALLHDEGKLRNSIYCIYVSPLRALSYDLEKNLNEPLKEIYGDTTPIRVGLRSGDTTQSERQKQLTKPPHLLLTTPESLALLLSQQKWIPHLSSVRWVIIDEIHALAENKRGAHLSISLERLSALNVPPTGNQQNTVQRIGLSATVAPLREVAQFLSGTHRACEVVDVSSAKKVDLRVYSPLGKNPYPPSGYTGQRLINELGRLVQENRTTLVFTNTRSGAEAAAFWLKQSLPDLATQIECHHASLDRDVRLEVEDRLKRGELRAVVCSTSLELGIDIGSVDLVVMLSTPKGVSRALQRTGRAGHNIRVTSRGLLMATNLNDLVPRP
jgi:ATP-dependent Lhr-like helicase